MTLSESEILALGRQIGRCYRRDPDSPQGQPPYRCYLSPGHAGICATPIYSMIEHDGIVHPGSVIEERFFKPSAAT